MEVGGETVLSRIRNTFLWPSRLEGTRSTWSASLTPDRTTLEPQGPGWDTAHCCYQSQEMGFPYPSNLFGCSSSVFVT